MLRRYEVDVVVQESPRKVEIVVVGASSEDEAKKNAMNFIYSMNKAPGLWPAGVRAVPGEPPRQPSMLDEIIGTLLDPLQLLLKAVSGIVSLLNKQPLEAWVKELQTKYSDEKKYPDLRKSGAKKNAVFDALMGEKAAKSAVINGLAGLANGALELPASAIALVVQWTMKAQVAYAVAYAYGQKPATNDEFAFDLFQIFAGRELIKEAISEIGDAIKDKAFDLLKDAGTALVKKIYNNPKVQKKLCEKIGQKMLSRIDEVIVAFGAATAAKEVIEKAVGPLMAIKDAIDGSLDIKKAAREARAYYYQFPNPYGTYVNIQIGAALDFDKYGGVTVRPYRGYDIYKKAYEIPRWVTLGSGKYVVNSDIMTITFNKVSWKESNWNAPCPIAQYSSDPNYYDVEATFCYMEWQCSFDGDDRFHFRSWKRLGKYEGDGYPTPGDVWWLVDPAPMVCTVNFDAQGGTPSPPSITVKSGSTYGTLPKVSRTGYKFDGWFDAASGGFEVKSSAKVTDNCTLYAQWTAIDVTIDFACCMPGMSSPSYRVVTYGSAYGPLPTIGKTGWRFDGWFSEGGKEVTADTIVNNEKKHVLRAHWTSLSIKVSFDANADKVPSPSPIDVLPGTAYGTLPTVNRSGYDFNGWFTELKGGTLVDKSTMVAYKAKDHKLHAHWSVQPGITVTFNPNGGNASSTTRNISPGYPYGTLPSITKPGSRLHGWFTDAKGGTKVDEKTVFTGGIKTLYAHWIGLNAIIVSFDARGPSNPEDIVISKSGSTYGTLPTVTRREYKFDGWFTGASGGTKVESTTKVPDKDHKLYAHWSEIPTSVKVTFEANGGKPSPASKKVDAGSKYETLPKVTKPGYDFGGWFDKASGGTEVKSTSKAPEKDHTLYAHWSVPKPTSVEVTFEANGGSKPGSSIKELKIGSTYGTLPTVTKPGYKFEGWFDKASGGTEVKSTTKVPEKDHTLYAHWTKPKPVSVKVTFDANGGKPSPASKKVDAGTKYETLPKVAKDGYDFGGWFDKASGGTEVKSTSKVAEKDLTLYAHWTKPTSVKVTFDANGGKAPSPASKTVKIGAKYETLPKVAKDGNKFEGWFDKASGGTEVKSTTKVAEKDHTLYAHWTKPTSVKVTFDANGGKAPSPASKTVDAGTKYETLPKVTKPGYDFGGWFDKASGGTEVKSTSKAPEKDHTLYAHWTKPKPVSVKVTFDANGGKAPSPASKTVKIGAKYETLPKVAKDGYKFEGWFDKASGGTEVKSTTKVAEKDHTLYAHWTKPSGVKVTFDANGGKAPSPTSKDVKGSTYGTLATVTKTGSKFKGWFTSAKGGTEVKASTKAPDKSLTLYAHWTDPPPPSNAHDSYCPTKVGMTLTYAHTSNYGGTTYTTYSVQTVKDVKGSGNNMTVTLANSSLDKNRKPSGSPHTFKQTIKNGVMVMDPNEVNPQLHSAKMEIKGAPIELPNDIKPGQSFKFPEINMTTGAGAEKVKGVSKMEGKCVAIEDVKVPAGTFKCRKITIKITNTTTTPDISTTTVITSTTWEAPNIGHVKTETYYDKIGLVSRSELVEIKGR